MLSHLKTSEEPNNSKSVDIPDLFKESLQELFKNTLYSPILAISEDLKGAKEEKQYEEEKKKKGKSLLNSPHWETFKSLGERTCMSILNNFPFKIYWNTFSSPFNPNQFERKLLWFFFTR